MVGMAARRGIAAGLMMAALVISSMAMSDSVSAQTTAAPGVISTTGGPKVTTSNLATTPNGGVAAPVAVPAFSGYPFGYGGYPFYGYQNYGYQAYYYGAAYPYNYGGPGYGYGYPGINGGGCVPSVSYTPAFGYGYGCQRVNGYYPAVAYPAVAQSPYQFGR